jgi:ferric-dicitrate binding protein FerR (iron transport regulator)
MTPEIDSMDPVLERAVAEIRDGSPDAAVVEAAAARVWARLAEAAGQKPGEHIRGCADFQALLADYRAGRLNAARAMLVKDHLNQCVACRRAYEGKAVEFPGPQEAQSAPRRPRYGMRWAVAAGAIAAGVLIWIAVDQYGRGPGRTFIQTVNGALYEISPAGIHPLAAGQDLPDGVDIRTAKDSEAVIHLSDGSTVDMRERAELSTTTSGQDLTIRLDRGNVIVQAAKRRSGHLYVATADCRVAVTGTVFSVNAGVKGSRVSVIQGEVHVAQDNREEVLHPGDQSVSGPNLEQAPIQYDISWSRNSEHLGAAAGKPATGRVSPLLQYAPANTAFFGILPDVAWSAALQQQVSQNPQLRAWFSGEATGMFAKLQAASEYLGEIALVGLPGKNNEFQTPVFIATARRTGFRDFLKHEGLPLAVEERPGLAVFGGQPEAVDALARSIDAPQGGFQGSPCYARLVEAQQSGADTVFCTDLQRMGVPAAGVRYIMGEVRHVGDRAEASRATIGFDGPRTGIAAWLAPPAPMGSLDYVSPDASFLMAFVVKSPAAIVEELLALEQRSTENAAKALDDLRRQNGLDVRNDLGAALGGEFALALDGPVFPTPSWKLIAEVYDPPRFESTIERMVEIYNGQSAKSGGKPLRTSQETVDGRVYYMVGAADPNPLTEAHYTFADGYLIAGPSRAIVSQALQARANRTSIARSTKFVSLMPRDHYADFSAVLYQNLGSTLGPLVGMLGSLAPQPQGGGNPLEKLGNMQPTFVAAYGEQDRVTIAGAGNMMGLNPSTFAHQSLLGIAGSALPLGQFQGTPGRRPAYRQ